MIPHLFKDTHVTFSDYHENTLDVSLDIPVPSNDIAGSLHFPKIVRNRSIRGVDIAILTKASGAFDRPGSMGGRRSQRRGARGVRHTGPAHSSNETLASGKKCFKIPVTWFIFVRVILKILARIFRTSTYVHIII